MKKIPSDKLIALFVVVLMMASQFAGAASASADGPKTNTQVSAAESTLMWNATAISGNISVTHVTSIHAEPSKTTLAPNENYVISVDYYVSHGDDYYFKAWYYDEGTWDEIYSQHIYRSSAGWFSLTIDAQAPEKIGDHTVRVAGTQDYWSTPYSYNVAHDFVITVTTPLPDLAISTSDIDVSHRDNEIDIIATVHNDGAEDANDVFIQFYAQDILTGAVTQIADNRIESIPHGHAAAASATWEPTLQYYRICVSVDPDDEITETDENNNIACKSVGGPTIVDVKSKYKGIFLYGITLHNSYDVFVDWDQDPPNPGKVKFILNGDEIIEPANPDSPSASHTYDVGHDFKAGTNELKIIAINDVGVESDPYIISPQSLNLHPWMLLFGPKVIFIALPFLYDHTAKYEGGYHIRIPDSSFNSPKVIPIAGGKYGMKAYIGANVTTHVLEASRNQPPL